MAPRPDGRLTHELNPHEKGPQDACGVFGVWAPGEEVAKLAYFGLYALQHRGQESAGIATSDGTHLLVFKDMGLVSQVFDEQGMKPLSGFLAVGHCRYSTTGESSARNAQPMIGKDSSGAGSAPTPFALAHNGNLVNAEPLAQELRARGVEFSSTSDSEVILQLVLEERAERWQDRLRAVLPRLRGAFSLVMATPDTLFAARAVGSSPAGT